MKRIWLDPTIALDVLNSKEALDALALCCMVKLTFADSMVKNATMRRLMGLFHLSHRRCVAALDEGLRRGLLVRDGNHLRAARVRAEKRYCVRLDIPDNRQQDELCPVTITQMCDILREAVLYNHIAKQNKLRDTIRLARDPKPDEHEDMKRAKARLRKKGVCVSDRSAGDVLRLSYAKMSAMLNVSRSKAKQLVKQLCDKGLVKRVLQFEETGLHLEEYSRSVQQDHAKYANRGFLVLCNGLVCLQLANAYLLGTDSLVKFFR